MNAIEKGRADIVAKLAGILDEGRIHRYAPSTVAAPCIYIGTPRLSVREVGGAPMTYATYPVTAVVDGAKEAQLPELDRLAAEVWTRSWTVGSPVGSSPFLPDSGTSIPSTNRGLTIDIDLRIGTKGLCDSPSI